MPSDVSLSDRAGAPEERGGKGPGPGRVREPRRLVRGLGGGSGDDDLL